MSSDRDEGPTGRFSFHGRRVDSWLWCSIANDGQLMADEQSAARTRRYSCQLMQQRYWTRLDTYPQYPRQAVNHLVRPDVRVCIDVVSMAVPNDSFFHTGTLHFSLVFRRIGGRNTPSTLHPDFAGRWLAFWLWKSVGTNRALQHTWWAHPWYGMMNVNHLLGN